MKNMVPSKRRILAEERVFNDPEYQKAHGRFVGWIDRLQRAQTADDLNRLQYDLIIELGARQDAFGEVIPPKRSAAQAEIARLKDQRPFPRAEVAEQQRLLARADHAAAVVKALQHSTRSLADGMVWRALDYDRTAIAILAEGQRVRRLAPAEGFNIELQALDWAREEHGVFAFHNDLTNCLRHGDVTAILPTGERRLPVPIEVKKTRELHENSPPGSADPGRAQAA